MPKSDSPRRKTASSRTSKRSAPSKAPARKAKGRVAGRAKKEPASAQKEKVNAYFSARPKDVQQRLGQIRALILGVAPDVMEWFSYGIPGFRLNDRPFLWYAAFSNHVSLFPMTTAIRTTFAKDLEGLETSK